LRAAALSDEAVAEWAISRFFDFDKSYIRAYRVANMKLCFSNETQIQGRR
jgi:hypothetical protein